MALVGLSLFWGFFFLGFSMRFMAVAGSFSSLILASSSTQMDISSSKVQFPF
ncbi:hypothetical protein RchiOBHm_Chr1g0317721 [Rosa chinensis]|uniref:Uncharacterized protein n=1 Tax=Rosa chinensis TaxID=74649 RepID=A0A2P6PI72_ROSCH|nr:hypothetical protein RchiOBHm_Chr7g0241331 [Rosa chinensis]PRQ54801.1 hypothetical protein RchiOBHm_Chr1g0317721 [Rosa chinensis]